MTAVPCSPDYVPPAWDPNLPESHHAYEVFAAPGEKFTEGIAAGGAQTRPIYCTCREGHISVGSIEGLKAFKARTPRAPWCPVCAAADVPAAARELARIICAQAGILDVLSGIVVGYLSAPETFAATLARPPSGLRFAYLIEWLSRDASTRGLFASLATPMDNLDGAEDRPEYRGQRWSHKFRDLLKFLTQCAQKNRARKLTNQTAVSRYEIFDQHLMRHGTFKQYLVRLSLINPLVAIAIAEPWYRVSLHNSMAYSKKELYKIERSEFIIKVFSALVTNGTICRPT